MKFIPRVLGIVLFLLCLLPHFSACASNKADTTIDSWKIKWEGEQPYSLTEAMSQDGYVQVKAGTAKKAKPAGAKGLWIKFDLPLISQKNGLFIDKLYGQQVSVYLDGQSIYEHKYDYQYGTNRLRCQFMQRTQIRRFSSMCDQRWKRWACSKAYKSVIISALLRVMLKMIWAISFWAAPSCL